MSLAQPDSPDSPAARNAGQTELLDVHRAAYGWLGLGDRIQDAVKDRRRRVQHARRW